MIKVLNTQKCACWAELRRGVSRWAKASLERREMCARLAMRKWSTTNDNATSKCVGELLESAATTLTTPAHCCTVEDCRRGGRDGGGGQTNERTDGQSSSTLLYSTLQESCFWSQRGRCTLLGYAMLFVVQQLWTVCCCRPIIDNIHWLTGSTTIFFLDRRSLISFFEKILRTPLAASR